MRSLNTIFFVLLAQLLLGQDIHFTQWMHAPHTYSPSSVGDFDGKYRFHGNYRNQWSSVTVPFVTFSAMAESNTVKSVEGLGVSAGIVYDVTGDSKFSTAHINLGAGYEIPEIPDSLGEFRIGIQPTITQKKIDLEALKFDNQYNGYYYDGDLPIGETLPRLSRWYFDFSLGIQYKKVLSSKTTIRGAFALYNVLNPKQSFYNDDDIVLDRRYSIQLEGAYLLNDKISIFPGIQMSFQGRFNAINFGSLIDYDLSRTNYFKQSVFAGAYFRAVDSGDLIVGLNYDSWRAAISYDINYSGLTPASNYRGGVELAIIYIIPYPRVLPKYKFCPDY